jgi:hypothetical protein
MSERRLIAGASASDYYEANKIECRYRRYYADMAEQWFVIAQGYEAHVLKYEVVAVKSRKR